MLFASHNLLRDPPFSALDLITCRNLLIYLNRDVQIRLLKMFHFALKPGGLLFLGSSESADAVDDYFITVDKKSRIYRARALPRSARNAPSLESLSVGRTPYLSWKSAALNGNFPMRRFIIAPWWNMQRPA